MRLTERVLYSVTLRDAEIATGVLPDGASGEANPNDIGGDAWSALLKHARSCDARAYEDLYPRHGFLPDPDALLAQARKSAVRKASNRIRCLTMAARVLSTLPKRYREVLIRAELALYSSAHLGQDLRGIPTRRAGAAVSRRVALGPLRRPRANRS